MAKTIEIECAECHGTGVYSGMGEDEHSAVVCHRCGGTGKSTFSYNEFTGRKKRAGIKWIYLVGVGIKVGGPNPGRFGGMSYKDWLAGKEFPKKSEDRECTCPCWWYQSADYSKKPQWEECIGCGSFSECPSFRNRSACWKRWDKDNKK